MDYDREDMQQTVRDMKETTRKFKMIQILFSGVMLVIIIKYLGLYAYWYFESDPLTVEYVQNEGNVSICQNRKYYFDRLVKTTKELNVTIQERYRSLDGSFDAGNDLGVLVNPNLIVYPVGVDTNKVMRFPKVVPPELDAGYYEYRPWATYEVNPIKTIVRPLPMQYLMVECELDIEKVAVGTIVNPKGDDIDILREIRNIHLQHLRK